METQRADTEVRAPAMSCAPVGSDRRSSHKACRHSVWWSFPRSEVRPGVPLPGEGGHSSLVTKRRASVAAGPHRPPCCAVQRVVDSLGVTRGRALVAWNLFHV
jgi:hypothetical protein